MGMRDRARESAKKTNQRLAQREKELLLETSIDWQAMRPEIGSDDDYQQLIAAVEEATQHNEMVGSVLERLEKLGSEGLKLAQKVRGLIPV